MREAFATLRRHRGFALGAMLLLGVAVGAAAAIYAVLETVLLKPLPIAAPERVMQLWESHARQKTGHVEVAYGNFDQWQARNRSFDDVALMTSVSMDVTLAGDGGVEPGVAQFVSDGFFRVLGATPEIGRDFARDETDGTGTPAAIISHALWQRRWHGADVLGRKVTIDGDPAEIVGVMPPAFDYPRGVEVWGLVQATAELRADHKFRVWRALGRLRDGVTQADAAREMDALATTLQGEFPELEGYGVQVEPLLDEVLGPAQRVLPLLQAAGLVVALIGALNVAHLLLVRTLRRRGEIATRRALGASDARLRAHVLSEGLVIGIGAALVAIAFAAGAVALLRSQGPADLPRLDALALSWTVALVAAALALATGAFAGFVAGRAAVRGAVAHALVEAHARGTEGPVASRARRVLVVSQLAIAMGLLACALPMLRSVRALESVDPGFEPAGVFSARVATLRAKYPDPAAQAAFFERLLVAARAMPGVESAAAVLMRPLSGEIGWDYRFKVEGQTDEEAKANPYSNFEAVSDGFFETMRMPLLRGRTFTRDDDAKAPPVVIVGESFAARAWPGQDAIGKRLKLNTGPDAPFATVVGIAPDGRYRDWRGVRMDLYAPFRQQTEYRMDFVLRSQRPTAELAREFRAAVSRIDPELAVSGVTSMDAAVDAALARPRFDGALLASFALLAALLAAAGVFGVALFTVEQRRVELGVRRALGASARDIARGVLLRALRDALIAVVLGVLLAIPAWSVLRGMLYGVAPHDPLSMAGSALLLAAAVLTASAIPAWRAARVAPAEALRHA